jgi:hypothetical protein
MDPLGSAQIVIRVIFLGKNPLINKNHNKSQIEKNFGQNKS